MLKPSTLSKGDIVAMDRAYIDYEKLEALTQREVLYVTKMKKNLKYNIMEDCMYQTTDGLMEVRIQHVTFSKVLKGGEILIHHARIITYADTKKHKLVALLTNDMESDPNEIIEIYRKRWEIELLFKQIKQNFPLKYFYGESKCHQDTDLGDAYSQSAPDGNEKRLTRSWSFSGLATMMRITLMYYVDFYSLFNHPEKDWETLLNVKQKEDYQLSIF